MSRLASKRHRKAQSSTTIINEVDDLWTKAPSVGETIVKLREGNGTPLIILHGGGGTIHAFSPLKANFSSALWAIQVTSDTPLHTLQAQSKFYFEKIKLFEKNGDTVTQLSFIDHFPTTLLAPVFGLDISKIPLEHPDARQVFLAEGLDNLFAMIHRDGRGNLPKRHQLANDLRNAYKGLPTSPFIENFRIGLDRFLNQIFDFLLTLKQEARTKGDDRPGKEFLEDWLRSLKAPVTAYLGTYGMLGSLIPEKHPPEEWYDLGIHRCFPNARVTVLDAGHYDILENPDLIRGLQEEIIVDPAKVSRPNEIGLSFGVV